MPLFLRNSRVEIRLLCVLLLQRLYSTSSNIGVAILYANCSAASSVNVASSSSVNIASSSSAATAKVKVNVNVATEDCTP
jgi:hypothetical protein